MSGRNDSLGWLQGKLIRGMLARVRIDMFNPLFERHHLLLFGIIGRGSLRLRRALCSERFQFLVFPRYTWADRWNSLHWETRFVLCARFFTGTGRLLVILVRSGLAFIANGSADVFKSTLGLCLGWLDPEVFHMVIRLEGGWSSMLSCSISLKWLAHSLTTAAIGAIVALR